jgi:sulfate adenylyltransferase large subunit
MLHADTLRFSTAGSVDDGKSTLIGRLLYDAQGLMQDQVQSLIGETRRHGHVDAGEALDFSLLTDGLIAEREQGITIDVAYRYFATPKRRFIIADTPGHEQYTRNMVTGASTADLTVVLIDAVRGATRQSRRHVAIAALLRIPHVIIAVNKMDAVEYSADAFARIQADIQPWMSALSFTKVDVVPVSALRGDMLVNRGKAMPWYRGPTLLELLESSNASERTEGAFRLAVQRVARAKYGQTLSLRGYQGRVDSGVVREGDELLILPAGHTARVAELWCGTQRIKEAPRGLSITVVLDAQLDISRGDMLVDPSLNDLSQRPQVSAGVIADLCWLDTVPLVLGRRYWLKHTTRTTRAMVEEVMHGLDIDSMRHVAVSGDIASNSIVRARLSVQQPLVTDAYADHRITGSFVLIDDATNRTVAAGLIAATALQSSALQREAT